MNKKEVIRTRPDNAIKDCGRVPRNLVVFTISKIDKILTNLVDFWWAFGDSNPGPTGYEPGALTN